jgi:2',3'-cyclic-nucleotide 2'-phosphodiesterase / 3'-nucleotidase
VDAHFILNGPFVLNQPELILKATGAQIKLRVLATTDLHHNICPYNYYEDRYGNPSSLALAATLINRLRLDCDDSILVDNGDFLEGTPMADYFATQVTPDAQRPHPMMAAMNSLGYDALALGNHEFNYGIPFLQATLKGAEFAALSCNIATKTGASPTKDTLLVSPYTILTRHLKDAKGNSQELKIGLIGFTPPQITRWDRQKLGGRLRARGIVEAARAWVPEMKTAGADIIIALCHTGIGEEDGSTDADDAAVPLAAIDGIDALVTGHTHQLFPDPSGPVGAKIDAPAGTLHGKPAVMAGFWGSHVGLIDLVLERDDHNNWRVARHQSAALPASLPGATGAEAKAASDPAIMRAVAHDHHETLSWIRRSVGRTTGALHSYFAMVTDNPAIRIVNEAQTRYMRDVLRDSAYAGLPVLSASSPFKSGGRGGPQHYTHVNAGRIAMRHIADLYVFPNTITGVKVSGQMLRHWLERSVSLYSRLTAGHTGQWLFHRETPSYEFDIFSGITYEIDLTAPACFNSRGIEINPRAGRIRDLLYQGRPVSDDQEFIVATNNFRTGGGGSYPGELHNHLVHQSSMTNRELLLHYITETGTVTPDWSPNWRFAPLGGTRVEFETGPGARRFLSEISPMDPTDLGDSSDGFARIAVSL